MIRKLLIAIPAVLLAGLVGLFATQSTRSLIDACVNDRSLLTHASHLTPESWSCAYLEHVRSPDPNEEMGPGSLQTVFGYALVRRPLANPRYRAIMAQLMARGVDMEKAHQGHLPALHLAIRKPSEELVTLFLSEGADPNHTLSAPDEPFDGLTALAYTRFVRDTYQKEVDTLERDGLECEYDAEKLDRTHEAVSALTRIEALLVAHLATVGAPSKSG